MHCLFVLTGRRLGLLPAATLAGGRNDSDCRTLSHEPLSRRGFRLGRQQGVENSELEWAEDSVKQVMLNCGLSEGAVIFLRLLQPISNDRSRPVAHQAELMARNPEGQQQFRLRPVSSRRRTQL